MSSPGIPTFGVETRGAPFYCIITYPHSDSICQARHQYRTNFQCTTTSHTPRYDDISPMYGHMSQSGHLCKKVLSRLKAAIPDNPGPDHDYEVVRRLVAILENAAHAQEPWHCRLCQVVPEIDRIADLVVNLDEKMHSMHNRLLRWFILALRAPYAPYSKTRRDLERECRTVILFFESPYSTDFQRPDSVINQPTSAMFANAREFQISGASVASLSGNSNTLNYFPVIITPERDPSTQQTAMEMA